MALTSSMVELWLLVLVDGELELIVYSARSVKLES